MVVEQDVFFNVPKTDIHADTDCPHVCKGAGSEPLSQGRLFYMLQTYFCCVSFVQTNNEFPMGINTVKYIL